MATELDDAHRRLMPFLFLPLDSQIFQSAEVFCESFLDRYGLTRKATYSSVTTEAMYLALQECALERAKAIAGGLQAEFHRIYIDLLWGAMEEERRESQSPESVSVAQIYFAGQRGKPRQAIAATKLSWYTRHFVPCLSEMRPLLVQCAGRDLGGAISMDRDSLIHAFRHSADR